MKYPKKRPRETSEADLIGQIAAAVPLRTGPRHFIHLGIGDDAALLRTSPGHEYILTCDWYLENVHFLARKHPPDAIGWKCLARAASDIAAMGGIPKCFLLSLGLPATRTGPWLGEFLNGLRRAATTLGIPQRRNQRGIELAGGDTTRSKTIIINVTVVGEVRSGQAVRRSGAGAGDILFVSGRLGEAELGWRLLSRAKGRVRDPSSSLDSTMQKHLYPHPRLALGRWLAEKRIATAMMDLSDGLSSDLPRLCQASGVGARIASPSVPAVQLPPQLTGTLDPLELALNGGEDYELLFTTSKRNRSRIPRNFNGIRLTAIGEITQSRKLLLVDGKGRERMLRNQGWDPFRAE